MIDVKRKAFELALITAVIAALLLSNNPGSISCWWFSAFPNPYTSSFSIEDGMPEIRFRLAEIFAGLFDH